MIVKLLTEHHLEFPSLKGGCRGSSEYTYTFQNATSLEISCTGSFYVTKSMDNVAFHNGFRCYYIDSIQHLNDRTATYPIYNVSIIFSYLVLDCLISAV